MCLLILWNLSLPDQSNKKKWYSHDLHSSTTPQHLLCHYATLWNGQTYVVRIVYNRYVILKHCPIDLNIRKYVHFACFWLYDKLNYTGRFAHFWTVATTLEMFVRPCFCSPSYHPHLTNGVKIEGFLKYLIFLTFSKNCAEKYCLALNLQEHRVLWINT